MSEFSTVARPYAKAAFDFALEQGQLDKWQAMLQFSALVAENEQVEEYISGALASGQIADFFCNICGDQLDQYGQNFIRVMAENRRLHKRLVKQLNVCFTNRLCTISCIACRT